MKTRAWLLSIPLVVLAGCGGGLAGTFEDEMGLSTYTFERGGRVVQSTALAGVELELRYEIEGDRVRIMHPDASDAALVLTRIDADTLSGPMGLRFVRKE
ncbi:hypothetical protein FZO89_05005 [Luteimonas viscosa]|uniref:Uncharacterized protein n=1 Tax=Luteimonas viscosa TaxID=1132694 RepID=A0A5D4XNY7_9GAMM|nr:hypothetical protein [Luteimonas viscosa]TYT25665.1 hypothetical protein FZO89_05005 [Luteimonas viscosa]